MKNERGIRVYKVLVFGIHSKLLLEELTQINSDYQIIGFTDFNYEYVRKEYNYLPFYEINEVKNVEFDYLIILARTQADNDKKYRACLDIGIPPTKMLPMFYWGGVRKDVPFCNHIEVLKSFDKKFEGYIFGMSYTLLGLYTHCLSAAFYKLSWWSADIHFMYKTSQMILNDKYTDKSRLKYIIIDIPYYTFNYDFSRNGLNFRKGLKFWEYFNDNHNLCSVKQHEISLLEYQLYMDMFGRKKESGLAFLDDITRTGRITSEMIEQQKNHLSHVWKCEHKQTIIENRRLFSSWISNLKVFNPGLKIIILVTPHSKYIEKYWPESINKCKELFYEIINDTQKTFDFFVWDYFNVFYSDDKYFLDIMHLNSTGAAEFSKIVEKRLKEEIYA